MCTQGLEGTGTAVRQVGKGGWGEGMSGTPAGLQARLMGQFARLLQSVSEQITAGLQALPSLA